MNTKKILGMVAGGVALMAGNLGAAETAAEKLGWLVAVHSYTFQKFFDR